jgi:hypothetical protein
MMEKTDGGGIMERIMGEMTRFIELTFTKKVENIE